MKEIEQLSKETLKRRLKAIYELSQDALSPEQLTERTRIENRLWELDVAKHPPIHTPKGFVDKVEDW